MYNIPPRIITLTAFLIGYALIDDTNSTQQSLLGGFFMLIGQTLSTNASSQFNGEWNQYAGQNGSNYASTNIGSNTSNRGSNQDMIDLLMKSRKAIDDQIERLKKGS